MASVLKVDRIETPSGVGNISFAQPLSGDGSQLTGVPFSMPGLTAGDVLYYDGTSWARLPKGIAAEVLTMNAGATAPEWGTGGGILEPASSATGDVLYYNGTNYVRLAKGTAGQALKINSGATAPEWGSVTAGLSTIWVPALAMVSPTTNGAEAAAVETTATRPEIKVLDFDHTTREHAQFSIAMPKSWDESTVTAQFYWTHATAVATDVIWGIQGVGVSDNDTINALYGTAVTVTDTFHNAANDLAITDATGSMTLGGTPAEGDLAYFQVYRDAAHVDDTTNATDARLIGVKILFTTNAENDA
jgi:hypothetical protein